jgi:PAS domain S-box-containing protein
MKIARNPHFWLILTLFGICCVSHYAEQIGIIDSTAPKLILGLNRQAIVRIFFLVPMIYTGIFFGIVGGITACSVALLAMLPRAIFFSPAPLDALLETTGVVTIGVIACLWLWTTGKQKAKTQVALDELQSAHKILQHWAQVAKGHERRLNLLNTISSMLLRGTLELEGILRKSTYMVSELMEVEVTLMFLLDEENKELRLAAHEGVSEQFAQFVDGTHIGEGVYGKVAKTGRPAIVEDTSHDFMQANSEFKKMQIRVQLVVPMILREEVHGVICVAMREGARLYERERLLVQHLTVAERNWRRLFENASEAIWMCDLLCSITNANKATEKLTGYNIKELTRMKAKDVFSDESLVLAGQVRRKLFQREPVEQPYEQHLIKKDGTKAVLMLTTSLITDEGKPIGFQHMARDVSRERWMQENMRHYLQQITRAQEDERKRIARDLHDDTAQALFAITRQVDNFIRSGKNLPPKCHAFMKGLSEQIREVLQRVRRFSQDLRPSLLDDLGLMATLRWLIKQLQENSGIEADLKVIGNERRLLPHIELMLFRIVQEAFRNVEKHAQASKVEVKVVFSEGKIMVSINDNGKGFDLSGDLGDLPRVGRLGLAGMEERAHLIGGSLQINTELDKGTMVRLNAPV